MEPIYRAVIQFSRMIFAIQGLKFTIRGAENVPQTGGAVMAINHLSFMDFAYAGLAAKPSKRFVRFMAKEEIFQHRISGPLMRAMRHIPVDRGAGVGSYRAAVKALKSGEVVGVFPEATLSRAFEIKDLKSGTIRMAMSAGVPVLPTIIWGAQRVWTKDHPKRFGRSHIPIFLSIGEPMVFSRGDDAEAATEQLRSRLTAMLHEAQAAYPELTGDDLKFLPARLGGTAPTLERAAEMESEEIVRRAERRAAKAAKAASKGGGS
jgi:1-acyl-sn-glycerol-3-phosphate acyltransferase